MLASGSEKLRRLQERQARQQVEQGQISAGLRTIQNWTLVVEKRIVINPSPIEMADSTFKPPALPQPASLFARILPRGLAPAGLKSAPGLKPRAFRPLTLSPDGVATIRGDCGTSPASPTAESDTEDSQRRMTFPLWALD
jgi:hypothetical protein